MGDQYQAQAIQNTIILEPSTTKNVEKYVIKHTVTKTVMETNLEENNNCMECIIEGVKDMGNVSKTLSQCSKHMDDCAGTSDVKSEPAEKNDNGGDTDDVQYDSEEFDEYKEDDFTKKLESMLASPTKISAPSLKNKHPKSATSVRSLPRSKSRSSIGSSSSVVSRHPKINMSFTNDRTKQIERENSILLNKILNAKSDKSTNPDPPLKRKQCNSSIARRRQQERIQHDNMIILKKIQNAKSSQSISRR